MLYRTNFMDYFIINLKHYNSVEYGILAILLTEQVNPLLLKDVNQKLDKSKYDDSVIEKKLINVFRTIKKLNITTVLNFEYPSLTIEERNKIISKEIEYYCGETVKRVLNPFALYKAVTTIQESIDVSIINRKLTKNEIQALQLLTNIKVHIADKNITEDLRYINEGIEIL